jgi:spore maturation protein CgeB
MALFYHSLVSDWNHGNAHFLRGVVAELLARGVEVDVYEPRDGWSLSMLRQEHGERPLARFAEAYAELRTNFYDPQTIDVEQVLEGVDLAIVHEWNGHDLVRRVGEYRERRRDFRVLFHDTHHRCVTDEAGVSAYALGPYDGTLAFGGVIRDRYLERGWTRRAWTWHEAADTRVFRPLPPSMPRRDLVWIGNWGDDERTAELHEFLLQPIADLSLSADIYGVRYPQEAVAAVEKAGARYRGWLANFDAPQVFADHRVTVHVPRRPYRESLVGIPTIRPFEALACGIPLVSMAWDDCEGLFRPGEDYLVVRNGREMTDRLREILSDESLARSLARSGLETIRAKHTCAHRVDELLGICREIGLDVPMKQIASAAVGRNDSPAIARTERHV